MRIRGELSLTLSILALVLMTVGSIMGVTLANKSLTRSSEASSDDSVVGSSRWFTSNPGLACNAWLTCTSSGPEILGISLDQNGTTFGLSGPDKNGKRYENTVMSSCQGGDETITVQYDPKALAKMSATFVNSYHVDENSVVLSINIGGGANTKFFVFNMPEGFNRNAPAKLVVHFAAKTAGQSKEVFQGTSIKGCEADGKPAIDVTPTVPKDPNKETTISWIFDDISDGSQFGDAKKFTYEARICNNSDCQSASKGETPIVHPTGATNQVIDKTLLKNNAYLQLSYSYLDASDKGIPTNYLVRHKPFFEFEINRGDEFVDRCYAFDSTDIENNKSCFSKILPGDHIDIHVHLDMKVILGAYGRLAEGKTLSNVRIEVCNKSGIGCYGAVTSKLTDVYGEEAVVSFPMSYEPYMIRFTGFNMVNSAPQYIRLMMEKGYSGLRYDVLKCVDKGNSTDCIFDLKNTDEDYFYNVATDWVMDVDLAQSGNIIQPSNPSPTVEPSPEPSPSEEPTPEPSTTPENAIIEVPFRYRFDMQSDDIDWTKTLIDKVYVLVQMCDANDAFTDCKNPLSTIFEKTYTAKDVIAAEDAFSVKTSKGNKIFNVALRYLDKNGTILTSSGFVPHMPFIWFDAHTYDMTDVDRKKTDCSRQGTFISCKAIVTDLLARTQINLNINSATLLGLGIYDPTKIGQNEERSLLLDDADRIQVNAEVYADKDMETPLYETQPVLIGNEDFRKKGLGVTLITFPTLWLSGINTKISYVVNLEYIPGPNTPKAPKPVWLNDTDVFKCQSSEKVGQSGRMRYRQVCSIDKNSDISDILSWSYYPYILIQKFTLDPGAQSESDNVVVNLAKVLRSSDINKDKVITILDLTAVFDAYYTTGDVPEDINKDGIVNIQDAMIVVSHLSESAP